MCPTEWLCCLVDPNYSNKPNFCIFHQLSYHCMGST